MQVECWCGVRRIVVDGWFSRRTDGVLLQARCVEAVTLPPRTVFHKSLAIVHKYHRSLCAQHQILVVYSIERKYSKIARNSAWLFSCAAICATLQC